MTDENIWCKREKAFDRVLRTIWRFICTWGLKYIGGMTIVVIAFAYPIFVLLGGGLSMLGPDGEVGANLLYVFISMLAYMALVIMGEDCESNGRYHFAIVFIFLFGLLAGVHLMVLMPLWTIWTSLVLVIPVVLIVVSEFLHEMCEIEKAEKQKELEAIRVNRDRDCINPKTGEGNL